MNFKIPNSFAYFVNEKARYKLSYGGRGAGRSWNVARILIAKAFKDKTRVLCAREIQQSINASVHQLLRDQITAMGLDKAFDITDREISVKHNGSQFIFEGLYRNVTRIKSLEGIDICWIEEAESISEESWGILAPTIRKDNSEIWITFNTRYTDDFVYDRFVSHPEPGAIVKLHTYKDNPFFPDVLRLEMEADKAYRPTQYLNRWLGEPLGQGSKIWTMFDEKVHIKEFKKDELVSIMQSATCYQAMDPAQHYYPACLWIAKIPQQTNKFKNYIKYVYAEWPTYDTFSDYFCNVRKKIQYTGTLMDLSKEIYHYDGTGEWGNRIEKRFIDTRFATGTGSGNYWSSSTLGLTDEFRKKDNGGLVFEFPSVKSIDAQRSAINTDLEYNTTQPITQFNQPGLYFAPWVRNCLDSMKSHRLEAGSEKENEKRKDFSDVLRILYAGMSTHTEQLIGSSRDESAPNYSDDVRSVGLGWMGS